MYDSSEIAWLHDSSSDDWASGGFRSPAVSKWCEEYANTLVIIQINFKDMCHICKGLFIYETWGPRSHITFLLTVVTIIGCLGTWVIRDYIFIGIKYYRHSAPSF